MLLRFLLTVEKCFEKSSSVVAKDSARMVARLYVFLKRFSFLKRFLVASLSIVSASRHPAFLIVGKARLFLLFACLSGSLHGVLDATCSESVYCERLWEITVVCCKWSCNMCRAFVTRSSETCSGFCAGEAVAEESSHPFQALLHPCFQRTGSVLTCPPGF